MSVPPFEEVTVMDAGGATIFGTTNTPLTKAPSPVAVRVGGANRSLENAFMMKDFELMVKEDSKVTSS